MGDLLKKADMGKYPDDDWREILGANGFAPSGVSEEVWRNPHSDLKVKIDVDRETEEPYYQVITEDGSRSAHWTDTEALKSIVEPKEQEPPRLSPEDEKKGDDDFLKSMGIIGHQRTSKKFAGRPPRFSFAVPTQAAGTVAFHLAKAGMKDFDVEHFEEDEFSLFMFPTEPEMHLAEEIVRAEYSNQIRSRKGLWGMWADKRKDPLSGVERELSPVKYVASAKPRKSKSALLAGYNFTNKGWLLPDGTFHGWSNNNIGHNEVAEELLAEPDPDGGLALGLALGDDRAADEGWVAVSNDGVNVMFTFKRLDRDTINLLCGAMINGSFPARPLITLSNSGSGQPREIHKDFDSPEQAEEWLKNL